MGNQVVIGSHVFPTQDAAEEYTYSLRDKYAHSEDGVTDPADLAFLMELFTKYCDYTADSTPFGHSAHADPDTCSTLIRTGSRSAATQGWHC